MDAEDMSIARGRLIKASPWLAVAFGRLQAVARPGIPLSGTDGVSFFYDPERLRRDPDRGSVALAHSTLHCLLGHPCERALDPLAADMAVALLGEELLPGLCPAHGAELFLQARHRLAGVPSKGIPAAMAADAFFEAHRRELAGLLTVDDHALWGPEACLLPRAAGAGEGWAGLRRRPRGGGPVGRRGTDPGGQTRRYRPGRAVNRSYRDALARYAGYLEEPREDPDDFDRNLYLWGLEQYGNLPIVEPPETREARRIDELAVVIDTSGSCVESLTTRFLDETRAMLADETLFARRFNLRILQCDAEVRRDDAITCLRDFERYIEDLEIVGGGGTDFRPAFRRIDRLIRRGAFRRLPAVLFFSDGLGLFPADPPSWDAIFVFFRGRYDDIDVPPWARKLVLEDEAHEHT